MPRKDKPTGSEIAQKARPAKLDRGNSAEAHKGGKKVRVIPADLTGVSEQDLEDGQVIGVLETELDEEDTGLPPGEYHMFMSRAGGQWQVLAESGGTVVAEARDVRFERVSGGGKGGKPEVKVGSIWIRICICIDWDVCWCGEYRFLR